MHKRHIFKILVILCVIPIIFGFKDKYLEKNLPVATSEQEKSKKEIVEKKINEITDDDLSVDFVEPTTEKNAFDNSFNQMESKLKSIKGFRDRVQYLHQELARIEKQRDQMMNLNFMEEIEIDMTIKPLKSLPKASQFKSEDCTIYFNKMAVAFDPGLQEDGSQDPGLSRALKIFRLICPK